MKEPGPLTSFQRAERLLRRMEKLGMECPPVDMIAETIQDAEFDTLNFPHLIADRHDHKSVEIVKHIRDLCGSLAERVAEDMDHNNKDHSKWYRKVKAARNFLTKFN